MGCFRWPASGCRKEAVFGSPDLEFASTSYVERSNLTIRMGNRRFTRLTNAFSKKVENHCHMLALSFMHYNYCRKHSSIKTTPAQAAGISDHQWTLEEVVAVIDAYWLKKEAEAFEAAFAEKWTRPRSTPKSWQPVAARTPWYLDPASGGPNPDVRKTGIAYRDDLP